jgi:hypothetical protein
MHKPVGGRAGAVLPAHRIAPLARPGDRLAAGVEAPGPITLGLVDVHVVQRTDRAVIAGGERRERKSGKKGEAVHGGETQVAPARSKTSVLQPTGCDMSLAGSFELSAVPSHCAPRARVILEPVLSLAKG